MNCHEILKELHKFIGNCKKIQWNFNFFFNEILKKFNEILKNFNEVLKCFNEISKHFMKF